MAFVAGMIDRPSYRGSRNLDALGDEEAQEARDRLEQQTFLARFGAPNPPPIVTATTVLPPTPTIPNCGDRRPKLNILQLITLAIVHHADRSPTGRELLQWIEERFEYFTWHPLALAHIRIRLQQFFFEYDPPVVPLSEEFQHVAMPWEAGQILSLRYAIVVGHLNILFPPPLDSFRFMKLPTELRLHVYEYALGLPCKQLSKGNVEMDKKWRDHIHSTVRYDEDREDGWDGLTWFRCPQGGTVLALLSVSKKVREEALPIFYRINTFSCNLNTSISQTLMGMGATRRSFLRSLTVIYHPWMGGWLELLQVLDDFKELETFTLWVPRSYTRYWNTGRLGDYHSLGTLRNIKTLTVHGQAAPQDVERIRAYLEPLVTQPREVSEEDASEGPARKKLKMEPE